MHDIYKKDSFMISDPNIQLPTGLVVANKQTKKIPLFHALKCDSRLVV